MKQPNGDDLPSRLPSKFFSKIIFRLVVPAGLIIGYGLAWHFNLREKFWNQYAKTTPANYIPLPSGLGGDIGSGYGLEISPINNLPPGLKNIADELRQNRINFQNNETKLGQWRFNESFEIGTYAEMRKAGRPQNDPACIRIVNRRYYLKEIIAKSSAIKKWLTEKNQTLLKLYDEAQIRNLTPETVGNKIKELNNKLSATAQVDFNQIDQIIKILEDGNYQISTKDWVIGDTDQFMDFGSKPH